MQRLFSLDSLRRRIACFVGLCCLPLLAGAQCGTPIASFPYSEDFEATPGGWAAGGVSSDWAWGAPSKPTIQQAASGLNCWVTGGLSGSFYNLGERAYVESPCFDFSALQHPYVQFHIWWESERQYDGANLQYSLNNGASWTNLGSVNDPEDCLNQHWYNSSSITNLSNLATTRHGWSGNIQPTSGSCQGGSGSNGWVLAQHCMPELAGKSSVRFRFTFGAGTACNDFDGIAFDDVWIGAAPAITPGFSMECTENYAFAFQDTSGNCPDAWLWNFGDPASGASNTSNAQNPVHIFSGPGLYMVSLRATSDCSGSAEITLPLEVRGLDINIERPGCFGGNNGRASAELVGPGPTPTYVWSTQPPQTGPVATNLMAGTYTVAVSGLGICPLTASVLVPDADPAHGPASNAVQAFPDTTIALGNTATLSGLLLDPGSIVSYQWSPETYLDCAACLNTLASPLQTTLYTLTAIDTNGCRIADAVEIKVLPGSVYIPNVFKPESGGQNDHFTVFAAKDVERVELLQIYDRWGSLVFENQDFSPSDETGGWDGFIEAEAATPGVYGYVVRVRFLSGGLTWYAGDVTVIW